MLISGFCFTKNNSRGNPSQFHSFLKRFWTSKQVTGGRIHTWPEAKLAIGVNYRQGYWVFLARTKSPDISLYVSLFKKLSDPSKTHWKKLRVKNPSLIFGNPAHPFTKWLQTHPDHRFYRFWYFFPRVRMHTDLTVVRQHQFEASLFANATPSDLLCFWRGALADRIYIPIILLNSSVTIKNPKM